jgi:hypothetical protein
LELVALNGRLAHPSIVGTSRGAIKRRLSTTAATAQRVPLRARDLCRDLGAAIGGRGTLCEEAELPLLFRGQLQSTDDIRCSFTS